MTKKKEAVPKSKYFLKRYPKDKKQETIEETTDKFNVKKRVVVGVPKIYPRFHPPASMREQVKIVEELIAWAKVPDANGVPRLDIRRFFNEKEMSLYQFKKAIKENPEAESGMILAGEIIGANVRENWLWFKNSGTGAHTLLREFDAAYKEEEVAEANARRQDKEPINVKITTSESVSRVPSRMVVVEMEEKGSDEGDMP